MGGWIGLPTKRAEGILGTEEIARCCRKNRLGVCFEASDLISEKDCMIGYRWMKCTKLRWQAAMFRKTQDLISLVHALRHGH